MKGPPVPIIEEWACYTNGKLHIRPGIVNADSGARNKPVDSREEEGNCLSDTPRRWFV